MIISYKNHPISIISPYPRPISSVGSVSRPPSQPPLRTTSKVESAPLPKPSHSSVARDKFTVVKCTFCDKLGHEESTCRRKNGLCLKCGATDHSIRDCPQLSRSSDSQTVTQERVYAMEADYEYAQEAPISDPSAVVEGMY